MSIEPIKRPLSRAEIYGEEVLSAMSKKPEDCNLFERLVPKIGNSSLIVFGGPGGGSIDLAKNFLLRLSEIHKPHCRQQSHLSTP